MFVSSSETLSLFSDPRKPDVSKYTLYEVKVEANIVNRNYTADYTIYFDYANHRAAQEVIEGGTYYIVHILGRSCVS